MLNSCGESITISTKEIQKDKFNQRNPEFFSYVPEKRVRREILDEVPLNALRVYSEILDMLLRSFARYLTEMELGAQEVPKTKSEEIRLRKQ